LEGREWERAKEGSLFHARIWDEKEKTTGGKAGREKAKREGGGGEKAIESANLSRDRKHLERNRDHSLGEGIRGTRIGGWEPDPFSTKKLGLAFETLRSISIKIR